MYNDATLMEVILISHIFRTTIPSTQLGHLDELPLTSSPVKHLLFPANTFFLLASKLQRIGTPDLAHSDLKSFNLGSLLGITMLSILVAWNSSEIEQVDVQEYRDFLIMDVDLARHELDDDG